MVGIFLDIYTGKIKCIGIRQRKITKKETEMKGYLVSEGYMGFVDGRYMLFASEADYLEYVNA